MSDLNWAKIIWLVFGVAAWVAYAIKQKPWRVSVGAFVLWMLLLPLRIIAGNLSFDN